MPHHKTGGSDALARGTKPRAGAVHVILSAKHSVQSTEHRASPAGPFRRLPAPPRHRTTLPRVRRTESSYEAPSTPHRALSARCRDSGASRARTVWPRRQMRARSGAGNYAGSRRVMYAMLRRSTGRSKPRTKSSQGYPSLGEGTLAALVQGGARRRGSTRGYGSCCQRLSSCRDSGDDHRHPRCLATPPVS
jgi:hypothetical protein